MLGGRLTLLLAYLLVLPVAAAAQEGDSEEGRKLATKHCARCHVVGDFNPYGGVGNTPSFQRLATNFPDYLERFQTFYDRPPHPPFVRIPGVERSRILPANAKPFKVTPENIEDIIAFVEVLKEEEQAKQ